MNRKILFIKGYSKTDLEEQNFHRIIQLYKDYFSHIAGGAYDLVKEFILLEEPSQDNLLFISEELGELDFLIVVILGHGAMKNNSQVYQPQKDLFIYPGSLSFNCPKQLYIIEMCRNIIDYEIEVKRINRLVPKYKYGGLVCRSLTKEESRVNYNEALRKSNDGTLMLFSSSPGESALDLLFIWALIEVSANTHTYVRNCIFTVGEIFEEVKKYVHEENFKQQKPIKKGRADFPFMIAPIWEPEEFIEKYRKQP